MNKLEITGNIKKFPGEKGWYYLPFDTELSSHFREMVNAVWPALLKTELKINNTAWKSSIMPIKDGPLFVALPANIRKAEKLQEGDSVTITLKIDG